MKKPDIHQPTETPVEESPSLEQVLNRAGKLTTRLISLMNKDCDAAINPEMIIPGELLDKVRGQKVTWNTGCFKPLELKINRCGTGINEITEVFISFHPGEPGNFDIFSEINDGLAREWVVKNQPVSASSVMKVKNYLQSSGSRKTDIASVKLVYARPNGKTVNADVPIAIQITMFMADDNIVSFDPLITYQDINEERGVFSRIVYKRLLDQLEKSIRQGEFVLISAVMKEAFRNFGLFETAKPKKDDDDMDWDSIDDDTHRSKTSN